MNKLEVCGRYLRWDDGRPFFYLGDTAWEVMHALTREEVTRYMSVRAEQGFTATQIVALAEKDGLRVPNPYGRVPLKTNEKTGLPDPEMPDLDGDYSYWDHVDFVIDEAAKNGLFVALLPTWGDKYRPLWGVGPKVFTPENAYAYGKWIGARYAEKWNIIWMLGGDRPLDEEARAVVDAMAKGVKEADPNHLVTFHPSGSGKSTQYLPGEDYIDFHTSQTGHDVQQCYHSDDEMRIMGQESPKPFMDAEPRYEDHPACFNTALKHYWGPADVRRNAYWNVLAGTCGHTYGNHSMWSCNREPCDYTPFRWEDVLRHPGAEQMQWVKALRLRGDFESFRSAPELVCEQYAGESHLAAARGEGYVYVYSPMGLHFTVRLSEAAPAGKVFRAIWFDPRTGEERLFGIYPVQGENTFVPPTRGEDWVLILEAV